MRWRRSCRCSTRKSYGARRRDGRTDALIPPGPLTLGSNPTCLTGFDVEQCPGSRPRAPQLGGLWTLPLPPRKRGYANSGNLPYWRCDGPLQGAVQDTSSIWVTCVINITDGFGLTWNARPRQVMPVAAQAF